MSPKQENKELYKKIADGLRLASRRFFEQKAANNETVVVCINGEVRHVPAKDLLKDKN